MVWVCALLVALVSVAAYLWGALHSQPLQGSLISTAASALQVGLPGAVVSVYALGSLVADDTRC
jgi:hypothetical protein